MSFASCGVILATEIPFRGSRTTNPLLSRIWNASRTGERADPEGLAERLLDDPLSRFRCPGDDPPLQVLDDMFRQASLSDQFAHKTASPPFPSCGER